MVAAATAASSWLDSAWAALRPPPKLSLSQWADRHFRLSAESSADPGRWRTLPYQRGVLDAITDPAVERVSMIKSARVGYTKGINAAIAYFMAADPCPLLVVQPTVETAKIYSKEEIAPMLRDVPALAGLVKQASVRSSANSTTHKTFPGGLLSMVGANSGSGLRMVSRRVVIFDEVDAYPPSAGAEGDPVKLGEKRAEYYWNRKIIAGSTPLVAGSSRIEELFLAGDRRRYYVPCPHCGHMDYLRFRLRDETDDPEAAPAGHVMRWPEGKPEETCFMCRSCGCAIEEEDKRAMIEAGEWRAEGAFTGHASFHIWAAYSLSPNATWAQIAAEFLEAKKRPETLRTFVNTMLGETWKELGEAPDWERLYDRRESYAIGSVPDGVLVVTAGADVQKDRIMYEVVGWGADKESFSVEKSILWGDTSLEASQPGSPWRQLDELLGRAFPGAAGGEHRIAMLAVDSGYNTQVVYGWARQHPMTRVIACKGVAGFRALVGAPSPVDVTVRGRRMQRGYKVWPIGVDLAKAELYGWLRLRRGAGDPPPGYCHFPEYDEDYFQQLTAEHLVTVVNRRTRRAKHEWQVLPNRENHYLDARILARAAANVLGIDRLPAKGSSSAPAAPAPASSRSTSSPAPAAASEIAPAAPARRPPPRPSIWGGRPRGGGGWLGRRR